MTSSLAPVPAIEAEPAGLAGWYRDRLALAGQVGLLFVSVGVALRLVMYAFFHEGSSDPRTVALCVGFGLVRDALTAPIVMAPLLFGSAAFRLGWLARPR